VGEKQAAARLEGALAALACGSPNAVEGVDRELRERVGVAEGLVALDLAGESRVRDSLRERLTQALDERRARPGTPAPRRPWVMRRPVLAAELAVLATVVLLAVMAPRSLAALVEPVVRMIERVRVGDHTQILRQAPQTGAEVAATLQQHRQRLANRESWHLSTPYAGFGGSVPPGEQAAVRRVESLDELRALTPTRLQVPTGLHRDEPVRFDHAHVAPGGIILAFFGSGATELLLTAFPVGEGRSVAYGRMGNRTTPDGRTVFESPELKTEELSFGGQAVVWDPDPEPPPRPPDIFSPGTWSPFRYRSESSALRWEEGGVSYSLMGRSLTREEAVDLFLSLRPLDELQ
jgi:hypothetical protein